jgi:hypothetical protein
VKHFKRGLKIEFEKPPLALLSGGGPRPIAQIKLEGVPFVMLFMRLDLGKDALSGMACRGEKVPRRNSDQMRIVSLLAVRTN